MPVVVAKDVHKAYGSGELQVHVLKGVSLSVNRGEMVAIMGPSAGGKTTLLNCLSGLDDIDSGLITIGGSDLSRMKDSEKTRFRATKMGYIFQALTCFRCSQRRKTWKCHCWCPASMKRSRRTKAIEALGLVGLSERANHYPSELSGGQQQRVTIARALVNQPEIVWADEPTGNLDSENAQEVMELLIRLNRELNKTFVIITHSDAVAEMSHRTVRMLDGLIVDDGTGRRPDADGRAIRRADSQRRRCSLA